jgi:small conductance mechanosensitive channel
VASGVMLLFLRPFRVTDKARISDVVGTVRDIGLFRTTILTDDGVYVSIPNATIFAGTIQNLSREGRRRVSFSVEIDRGENIDQVQKTIREAMVREPRILKIPSCAVDVDTLGPLSTTLIVHAWVENRDFLAVQSDIKKLVRHALQGSDVSAPIPVPAPAVAPWTPPAEKSSEEQSDHKPN